MLAKFLFGKRRAVRRKSTKRKSSRKVHHKLPAKLVKLCKRYHVKTTTKRGGKRVTKSVAVLKRACAKKIRSLLKRTKKSMKRHMKSKRRTVRRRSNMGEEEMAFGKRRRVVRRRRPSMSFGACGANVNAPMMSFGAKRRMPKVSKAAAMKAFKQFYSKHCTRQSRFGNGGNPMLSQSMGYEFCSGGGGVLGANSTGLFPSPCMGGMTGAATSAFGLHHGVAHRRREFGMHKEEETPMMRRRRREFGMHKEKETPMMRRRRREFGMHKEEKTPMMRRSGFGINPGGCKLYTDMKSCNGVGPGGVNWKTGCEWNRNKCVKA